MLKVMIPKVCTVWNNPYQFGNFQIGVIIFNVGCVMVGIDMSLFPSLRMCANDCVDANEAEIIQLFIFKNSVVRKVV